MKYFYNYLFITLILILYSNAFGQWTQTNGPYGNAIRALTVVVNGTNDTNFIAGTDAGIYLSTNDGFNWSNADLQSFQISDFTVTGNNSNHVKVFAGTFGSGFYLSTDYGSSWVSLNNILNDYYIYSLTSFVNSLGDTTIIAGTGSGIYRSTDNGSSWTKINNNDLSNTYISSLVVADTNIFAGTTSGVYLSTDNGSSWSLVDNGLTLSNRIHLTVAPNGSGGTNIFAAVEGSGIFLSTNNGTSWTKRVNGITHSDGIQAIYAFNKGTGSSEIFAGTYFNGVFLSTDNGANWTQINNSLASTAVNTFATLNKNLYAGTEGGVFFSTDDGSNWTEINNGITGFVGTLATLDNGSGKTQIFAGSIHSGVYLSTDDGAEWTLENNGLTLPFVNSIAIMNNGSGGNNIFAGTIDGGVYISTDDGANWSQSNNGLTNISINSIVISNQNIFAGTDAGVFLSTNGGSDWSQVNNGIPDTYVSALAVAPNGSGGTDIFAGTNHGVFVTANNGTNWTQINNGLADTLITCLAVSDSSVYTGTVHGGVFVANITTLKWLQDNVGLTMNYISSLMATDSLVFVGANHVYLKNNNSSNWTKIDDGLNNETIETFAVSSSGTSGKEVYIGTYGHGVWKRPLSNVFTSVKTTPNELPSKFVLEQNYPNPFNPTTEIKYSIPKSGLVNLSVFNVLGQKVAVLINGFQEAGGHNISFNPKNLTSGIYFYRLKSGSFVQAKKMVLLK